MSGLSCLLMAFRTDLGQGCSSADPELSTNVSLPGTGFWRMIYEARRRGYFAFTSGPKQSNSHSRRKGMV